MLLLKDLKKTFRNPDGSPLPVLDIPEFRLGAGEQIGLVGRSGCGKTTLLHIIAGIGRPDSGKVRIDDWDITLMPEAECDRFRAERIGYVFQTFNLLGGLHRLRERVGGDAICPRAAGSARASICSPASAWPPDDAPARPAIGRRAAAGGGGPALANKPQLLLADEPTANVDAGHQQQILDLIRETCQEEKVALIIVTHSQEVANQFSRVDHLEEFNRATVGIAIEVSADQPQP